MHRTKILWRVISESVQDETKRKEIFCSNWNLNTRIAVVYTQKGASLLSKPTKKERTQHDITEFVKIKKMKIPCYYYKKNFFLPILRAPHDK